MGKNQNPKNTQIIQKKVRKEGKKEQRWNKQKTNSKT